MKNKSLFQIIALLVLIFSFLPPMKVVEAANGTVQTTTYNTNALKQALHILRNTATFVNIVNAAKAESGMPYNSKTRGASRKTGPFGPWHYQYGVCTDAVIDSYVAAGVVSNWNFTGPAGWNLRWVPTMFKYFTNKQVILGMDEPWLPGDVAFYAASNEKDNNPGAHVSIVIAVNDQGQPTRIVNAGGGKAGERVYSRTMANLRVTRHGRLANLHNLFLATYQYSAIWVAQNPYPTVAQGQSVDLSVVFRNTGAHTWSKSGANPVRIGTTNPVNNSIDFSSPFVCPTWLGNTRPANLANASVAPGNNGTFNFKICVPTNMPPGTYRISVAPLVEGITWMFQPGVVVYWNITVRAANTPTLTLRPLTVTPTITKTLSPSSTSTSTPTETHSVYSTSTPTLTLTSATDTNTPSPTPVITNTSTPTSTVTLTLSPTRTATPTGSVPPTITKTPTPTHTPMPTVHLREQIYWDEIHNGSVDLSNFERWPFLFTDWRAYALTVTRTGGDAIFRMKVFNSNGQLLVSATGSSSIFVTGLYAPENYYATVEATSGSSTYNISITQPTVFTRDQLLWNQSYSGSVSLSRFEKWPFLFTATRHFQVNLTRTSGDAIFRLFVLDSAGHPLLDPSEGSSPSISDTFGAGNYSILVQPVSGSGTYTISIIQLP